MHEAHLVAQLAMAMCDQQRLTPTVLTYYACQKKAVHERLGQYTQVNVHTIDSEQGREFPYCITSAGRAAGVGFAGDRRRATVAISRAQLGNVLVCTSLLAAQSEAWRNLSTLAANMQVQARVYLEPDPSNPNNPNRLVLTDLHIGHRVLHWLHAMETAFRDRGGDVESAFQAQSATGRSLQTLFDLHDIERVGSFRSGQVQGMQAPIASAY